MHKRGNKLALIISLFAVTLMPAHANERLKLSTTTSTDNSGLLSVLHQRFEDKHGVKVSVIAVGTGKALKLASHGDVDVVLAHAPEAELQYVARGDLIQRTAVMHNDFVIVGRKDDPAHISKAQSASQALGLISVASADFISRGDDSGTYKKEKSLWLAAGIKPEGAWYIEAGQGMGAALKIADEKGAYTLSDRATYIAYADKISLKVLFAGDKSLFNPYHVMMTNPAKHHHVNSQAALKYINFITGAEGQAIINGFYKAGKRLFYGDAR